MTTPATMDVPLVTAYTIGLGIAQPMASAGFTLKKVVIEMDGREVTFNYDGGDAAPQSSTAPPPLPPVKMPPAPRIVAPPAPSGPVPYPPPPPPPPRKFDAPAATSSPPPPPAAAVDEKVPFEVTKEMCIEPPTVPKAERAPIWCLPPYGEAWPPNSTPVGYDPAKRPPVAPHIAPTKPVPYGLTLPPNPPVLPSSIAPPLIGNKRHMPVEGVYPLTDDDPCPLKKHKDIRMGDVPADYLIYLADNWERFRKQEPRMWAYVIRHRDVLNREKETNAKRS